MPDYTAAELAIETMAAQRRLDLCERQRLDRFENELRIDRARHTERLPNPRVELVASDIYATVFSMLDGDVALLGDDDGMEAGRIAAAVEIAFRRAMEAA